MAPRCSAAASMRLNSGRFDQHQGERVAALEAERGKAAAPRRDALRVFGPGDRDLVAGRAVRDLSGPLGGGASGTPRTACSVRRLRRWSWTALSSMPWWRTLSARTRSRKPRSARSSSAPRRRRSRARSAGRAGGRADRRAHPAPQASPRRALLGVGQQRRAGSAAPAGARARPRAARARCASSARISSSSVEAEQACCEVLRLRRAGSRRRRPRDTESSVKMRRIESVAGRRRRGRWMLSGAPGRSGIVSVTTICSKRRGRGSRRRCR